MWSLKFFLRCYPHSGHHETKYGPCSTAANGVPGIHIDTMFWLHVLSTEVDNYRSVFHCLFCGTPHFLQHLHLLCCMNRSENFLHGKEFQMKMKRLSPELLIANETSASVSLLSFSAQELWFQNVKKRKEKKIPCAQKPNTFAAIFHPSDQFNYCRQFAMCTSSHQKKKKSWEDS